MGKLTDVQIRKWIAADERFEGRGDGNGLSLRYRPEDAVPSWLFRYRFAGKQRVMGIGNYTNVSLADARKEVKLLSARVALGHDVAAEKQVRKAQALADIDAAAWNTVGKLADEYFERNVAGKVKHPNRVRSLIEKDIKLVIGKKRVDDVKPVDIDSMLQKVVKRGAPTVANDVLRLARKIFDYAVKRHLCLYNPAAAFDLSDAGGQEEERKRWLTKSELLIFFSAMRAAKGFSIENVLTVKLLLLLAVRKQELTAARWDEFDLDAAVWHLPEERTKTSAAISIPLPALAVEWLRNLERLACGSAYVLPARKMQHRMLPQIHENTLNVALSKVKHGLEPFTIHDLRRTARSHFGELGVLPHIAEKLLNHKLPGLQGRYDRFHYFEERKAALDKWAALLGQLEEGVQDAIPLHERQYAGQ